MRHVTIFVSILAVAASWGQEATLRVTTRGSEAGTARCAQKLLSDGSKQVTISMDLKQGGRRVRMRAESVYGKDGRPIRMIQEATDPNGKVILRSVATFVAEGARLQQTSGGQTTEKMVPLSANLPRAATSEFWFIRDAPKPGAVSSYYSFSVTEGRWNLRNSKYVGPKTVQLGATTYRGHLLKDDDGTTIVDDQGLPIVIEMGDLRMERVPQ